MSLLETVCAVTIMGSVSAVAVPRVVDLPAQARCAVVESLRGATESASNLMHVSCAVQPSCRLSDGASSVRVSGSTVAMWRGYPQGGHPEGILNALQLSGFTAVQVGDQTIIQKDGAPRMLACAVHYTSPQEDGGAPTIVADTSGC